MPQGRTRVHAAATVSEGGTIHFRCDPDVSTLRLIVPSVGLVLVPVRRGRAEYPLPPQVRGGATISVTDGVLPNPTGISIQVVGGNSR